MTLQSNTIYFDKLWDLIEQENSELKQKNKKLEQEIAELKASIKQNNKNSRGQIRIEDIDNVVVVQNNRKRKIRLQLHHFSELLPRQILDKINTIQNHLCVTIIHGTITNETSHFTDDKIVYEFDFINEMPKPFKACGYVEKLPNTYTFNGIYTVLTTYPDGKRGYFMLSYA